MIAGGTSSSRQRPQSKARVLLSAGILGLAHLLRGQRVHAVGVPRRLGHDFGNVLYVIVGLGAFAVSTVYIRTQRQRLNTDVRNDSSPARRKQGEGGVGGGRRTVDGLIRYYHIYSCFHWHRASAWYPTCHVHSSRCRTHIVDSIGRVLKPVGGHHTSTPWRFARVSTPLC